MTSAKMCRKGLEITKVTNYNAKGSIISLSSQAEEVVRSYVSASSFYSPTSCFLLLIFVSCYRHPAVSTPSPFSNRKLQFWYLPNLFFKYFQKRIQKVPGFSEEGDLFETAVLAKHVEEVLTPIEAPDRKALF
jgi:hypothetical protein